MSANEKRISFLNGYFIYKKVGERVDPKKREKTPSPKESPKKTRTVKKKKKKKVKKLPRKTAL